MHSNRDPNEPGPGLIIAILVIAISMLGLAIIGLQHAGAPQNPTHAGTTK